MRDQPLLGEKPEEAFEGAVVAGDEPGAHVVAAHLVQVEPDQVRRDLARLRHALGLDEVNEETESRLVPGESAVGTKRAVFSISRPPLTLMH